MALSPTGTKGQVLPVSHPTEGSWPSRSPGKPPSLPLLLRMSSRVTHSHSPNDVGRCLAPQPQPLSAPVSFQAGSHRSPAWGGAPFLPLLVAARDVQGLGGGPLHPSLPLPPDSPFVLARVQYFIPGGRLGRQRPRSCSRLGTQRKMLMEEARPAAKWGQWGQPGLGNWSLRLFATPGTGP